MHDKALPGGLVLIKPIGSRMEPYTTADTVAHLTNNAERIADRKEAQ